MRERDVLKEKRYRKRNGKGRKIRKKDDDRGLSV